MSTYELQQQVKYWRREAEAAREIAEHLTRDGITDKDARSYVTGLHDQLNSLQTRYDALQRANDNANEQLKKATAARDISEQFKLATERNHQIAQSDLTDVQEQLKAERNRSQAFLQDAKTAELALSKARANVDTLELSRDDYANALRKQNATIEAAQQAAQQAKQEHAELLQKVLDVAAEYGSRYNLCEQLESALDEIGILPEPTRYTATVITHHSVDLEIPWRRAAEGITTDDVLREIVPGDVDGTDDEIRVIGTDVHEFTVTSLDVWKS